MQSTQHAASRTDAPQVTPSSSSSGDWDNRPILPPKFPGPRRPTPTSAIGPRPPFPAQQLTARPLPRELAEQGWNDEAFERAA
jgi:hypothetical protein